ncbi:MAG: hypothetical protein ACRD7E_14560, partial [Bryobacteraceae bacterium]
MKPRLYVRLHTERERVPAVSTHELGKSEPAARKADVVSQKNANRGVPDLPLAARPAQEGMPAEARIFQVALSLRHLMNFVPQDAAWIMNRLPKNLLPRLLVHLTL